MRHCYNKVIVHRSGRGRERSIISNAHTLLIALSLFSYFGFACSFCSLRNSPSFWEKLLSSTSSSTSTSRFILRPSLISISTLSSSALLLSSSSSSSSSILPDVFLSPNNLCTPEQYAQALNMTVEQVRERKDRRRQESENLHLRLQSKDINGKEKHEMMCRHLLKNGRHPFSCPNCWSYQPICVCDLALPKTTIEESAITTIDNDNDNNNDNDKDNNNNIDIDDSVGVDVVVWIHHREWGLISNTGIILPLTLPNFDCQCQLLMKGLPQHDQILEDIIAQVPEQQDRNNDDKNDTNLPPLVVVLWPEISKTKRKGDNKNVNNENDDDDDDMKAVQQSQQQLSSPLSATISIDEIKKEMNNNPKRRIVLIAVDGTWRNARRMVSRLPSTIPRLDLSMDTVFSLKSVYDTTSGNTIDADEADDNSDNGDNQFISILAPLRSRGGDDTDDGRRSSRRQVCTAEAVVGALIDLGTINELQGKHVLDVTKTKVERVCRYRGKEI